ncbi:hypothetical protein UFOVP466_43 [uncultured Caudovirales phage]|uniref:DUF5710 domain-containing protein n=1 Tax=uncultured Caudovirales phage TaxID=2100421 RepID=A0A6J5T1Z4_9CAUD|nr:hypothetical protein UFOVP466_43 [uncultured Caudovirales phage]CAB4180718.1 hypothetical protein UFOVP1045_90 [uncultured Caudovirales phage]CAB4190236.1 hypothetical protein UFOVP1194_44 [uncultured Caudovirales phage]CAB4221803.1 hypothetical protein UFOVP1641_40 [uncultured Caudovirales phage]
MATKQLVAVSGNTYPVKDRIKALGARWDGDAKAWMVPADKADEAAAIVAGAGPKTARTDTAGAYRPTRCKVCGEAASRYGKIYGSGECRDCYEERKMGY